MSDVAPGTDPRHRDVVRRDRRRRRRGGHRRCCRRSVSSQVDLHARYGGVVPEIASRAHVELLIARSSPRRFVEAGLRPADDARPVDAVAATVGPGLVGALLVGVSRGQGPGAGVGRAVRRRQPPRGPPLRRLPRGARPRAAARRAARVGRAHAARRSWRATAATGCSARPSTTPPARPSTRSPATSASATRAARPSTGWPMEGDPDGDRASPGRCSATAYDFSFSGLKTAVVNHVRKHPDVATADVAASFQEAVVDVLVDQGPAGRAARSAPRACASAAAWPPTRCCASGSSTPASRTASAASCPSRAMCTDNAAMVAAAGLVAPAADGPDAPRRRRRPEPRPACRR